MFSFFFTSTKMDLKTTDWLVFIVRAERQQWREDVL